MKLPEYITICRLCAGRGEFRQNYCDVPIPITGPCTICYDRSTGYMCGTGLIYEATSDPAPLSVLLQVAKMNKGAELPFQLLGRLPDGTL